MTRPGARPGKTSAPTDGGRTVLQLDLSLFLVDLSIALHRFAMYPPGHSSLGLALQALARRADVLLSDRPRLAVGVARDRLVIEGVVTDQRQPLLRALAGRLHRHRLSALSFSRGVTMAELADVVKAIAEDPDRGSGALGTRAAGLTPAWPHVSLHPLTVDGLEIVGSRETEGGRAARSAELWIGLAQAALGRSADTAGTGLATEPAVIARAIDDHQSVEAYDQVIVGYMLQIAEEVREGREPDTVELRRRVSALVSAMHPETLRRLLAMGGSAPQRQQFLQDAATGMRAGAVVDLVKAAAEAAHEDVSNGLVRMLTKLAAHAEAGAPAVQPLADSALRQQVARLTAGWDLPDPNPADYTDVLRRIAQAAPPLAAGQSDSAGVLAEPIRLVEMCLELEEEGPALWRAVDALVEGGDLARVIDALHGTHDGEVVARRVRGRLASADTLRRLLARDPPDFSAVDALLPHLSGEALCPLLDVLVDSDDRRLRRAVFDRLRRTGSQGAAQVLARMADDRWYVLRNLLALLAELETLPAECDPSPWLAHKDARVRREALRVALRVDRVRDRALSMALADGDERVLRLAVTAARDHSSPATTLQLSDLAGREALDDELRAVVVEALAKASPGRETLELLLRLASGNARLFRWRAGAPKSQTVIATLTALAANWPRDPRAAAVVGRAAAARHTEVRVAPRAARP